MPNPIIQCQPVDCGNPPRMFSSVTINEQSATRYSPQTVPDVCDEPFSQFWSGPVSDLWYVGGYYFWVSVATGDVCDPDPTYHAYRWWTDEFGCQYGDHATACCSGTASLDPFKPFDDVQYRVVAIP